MVSVSGGPRLVQSRFCARLRQLFSASAAAPSPGIFSVPSTSQYKLTESDVQEILSAHLLFGADLIYDPDIVAPLFRVIAMYLRHNPKGTVLLSMERRINFSLDEMDAVSPAYRQFQLLQQELVSPPPSPPPRLENRVQGEKNKAGAHGFI